MFFIDVIIANHATFSSFSRNRITKHFSMDNIYENTHSASWTHQHLITVCYVVGLLVSWWNVQLEEIEENFPEVWTATKELQFFMTRSLIPVQWIDTRLLLRHPQFHFYKFLPFSLPSWRVLDLRPWDVFKTEKHQIHSRFFWQFN